MTLIFAALSYKFQDQAADVRLQSLDGHMIFW